MDYYFFSPARLIQWLLGLQPLDGDCRFGGLLLQELLDAFSWLAVIFVGIGVIRYFAG